MFPGPNAQVYYNEAGEPLGWDYPGDNLEDGYDPEDFLGREAEPEDGEECVICHEFVPMFQIEQGEGAEMHNPNDPNEGGFCHATCGTSNNWHVS